MEIIRQSFIDIVQGSISQAPRESLLPLKRGYVSKITMLGAHNNVYLLFNKGFLRLFCARFLNDMNPSEESLEDMARELANLTIGRAKVLAQEHRAHFNISTPAYLGRRVIGDYDKGLHFCLEKGRCSIYMRRTH